MKSTALLAPVITKLINVQQDRAINVNSTDGNLFYGPLKHGFSASTCSKLLWASPASNFMHTYSMGQSPSEKLTGFQPVKKFCEFHGT